VKSMNALLAIDPTAILTPIVAEIGDVVTAVAPLALGVGVGVFGLVFGWGLLQRFVH